MPEERSQFRTWSNQYWRHPISCPILCILEAPDLAASHDHQQTNLEVSPWRKKTLHVAVPHLLVVHVGKPSPLAPLWILELSNFHFPVRFLQKQRIQCCCLSFSNLSLSSFSPLRSRAAFFSAMSSDPATAAKAQGSWRTLCTVSRFTEPYSLRWSECDVAPCKQYLDLPWMFAICWS